MYREKLISQIEALEKAQTRCNDVQEFITLSRNILDIAKKIDELDEKTSINIDIDSKKIYKAVCKANDEYRKNRTVSPFETFEQAVKEALEDISNQALN